MSAHYPYANTVPHDPSAPTDREAVARRYRLLERHGENAEQYLNGDAATVAGARRGDETDDDELIGALHAGWLADLVATYSRPDSTPAASASDIADALALLAEARAHLEWTESVLLEAARRPDKDTGRPVLTWRRIAAALNIASEQGAQGRYQRRAGAPQPTETTVDTDGAADA